MELRLPPIFFWDSDPSIAIPPLGSGNGGLDWQKVKPLIETKLKDLDVDIQVYEPMEM